jgi:GDP/UDP-N,N'-diacetylbacillosamine 2-epimerase (hydrolysing)
MSHLHFVSTDEYKKRVMQLGEQPQNVFKVGAIGLDNIAKLDLLTKEQLEDNLKIRFKKYNYLITFHPETLVNESVELQFNKLLMALDKLEDSFFVFTKANADTNGRIINQLCEKYAQKNSHKSVLFDSLGTLRYLSVMKICDAIVGNSSSGIIEAPSVHTPTINIGNRQKGRIQASSVLNSDVNSDEIYILLMQVQSQKFKDTLKDITNPYGNGNASSQIEAVLSKINLSSLLIKKFYDIQ